MTIEIRYVGPGEHAVAGGANLGGTLLRPAGRI